MRRYLQRPSEERATKAYRVRVIRHINSKTLQKTTHTLQWRTMSGTLSNLALTVMTLCYWSVNPENHVTWHDSLLLVDWRNVAAIFVQVDRYWERIVQVGQQFCRGHRFSSDVAKHAPSTRHTLQTTAETAWPATITTTTDAIYFSFFCLTTFLQLLQNQGTMPGARRWGRPRTAWIDNIKSWTGLYVEESIRMTADRHKWRKYIHGVANPRIEEG